MTTRQWWSDFGSFEAWTKNPHRPHPAQVIRFALQRLGIKPERQAVFLMEALGLRHTTAYSLLQGQWLDSLTRCRLLVKALNIHPPLLGIESRYHPVEYHPYWWREQGFPFDTDANGYPKIGQVIAHLRKQRTKREREIVKVWTQSDLGEALGLTKITVYKMENEQNPEILDRMSRRTALARVLSMGAILADQEQIFRLFGLDPQAHGITLFPAPRQAVQVSPKIKNITPEMLASYDQQQANFYSDYSTQHGQGTIKDVLRQIKHLETMIMPLARTTEQRVRILALQSRYHRLLLNIAREQCQKRAMETHAKKAIQLAEDACTLPELKSETGLWVISSELLVAAILRRALAYRLLEDCEQAQQDIDRALALLPNVQSIHLKNDVWSVAGLVGATTARSATGQTIVLSYFDKTCGFSPPQAAGL